MTSPSAVQIKNLLDTTSQCLNNLKNQEIPVEYWDQIIIYTLVQKLDVDTHTAWEEDSYKENSDKLSTWEELKTFLETKYRTLEMVNPTTKKEQTTIKAKSFHSTSPEEKTDKSPTKSCSMCNAEHPLFHCKEFSKLQPQERNEFIKKNRLCFNCLTSGHSVKKCRNRMSCRRCNRRHHTLLHQPNSGQSDNMKMNQCQIEVVPKKKADSDNPEVALTTHFVSERSTVLLATALVQVTGEDGHNTELRALVDQGSQANFISERAAQLLKAKRTRIKGTITGVGAAQTTVNHVIRVELCSTCQSNFQLSINAYVMPTRLTSHLPSERFNGSTNTWPHLKGLTLADPSFNSPGRVDMLLGVEVCAQILKAEIIKGPPGSPCAQNTSLGWILFGRIQAQTSENSILVMHHKLDIDELLKSMWEVETDTQGRLSKEEEDCERIYEDTYTRNSEGRYIVKLPFKTNNPQAPHGNTKEGALSRLCHLERRLMKSEDLKREYTKAINEYKEMKHMEEVPSAESNKPAVYLPHHAVVKKESETTK
ncbi:uncharacterized protein LOC111362848, partial [Spodoptera litura]|uniref:Uncharacterized protein LOC111362848 n=1 Tax=Spodoptera litura TaxID=69820 RepID=A0A9J7EPH0_SPOLT